MKRVLVAGAGGMLGTDIVMEFSAAFHVAGLSRAELDITDKKAVEDTATAFRPDIVINCAAFTRVDECESMADKAFEVNAGGAANLAAACRDTGALLVHISTDYVFDGSGGRPWKEDDPAEPINVYGRSKLQGEVEIRKTLDAYLIVRTSWLFGRNGPNFIRTVLRLAAAGKELSVVDDQFGSPTYTRDLAGGIRALVDCGARGVFHCSNSGSCSWFDLCRFVFECKGIRDARLSPVPAAGFPRPARRPSFSVLDTSRFQETTGRNLRPWQEAVAEYLKDPDEADNAERAA